MLEWLGIAALYAGCLGFMAWWIFRPKKGAVAQTKPSPLDDHLESAFQRATRALEHAQKENSGHLLADWLGKVNAAYQEGLSLLARANKLTPEPPRSKDPAVRAAYEKQRRHRQDLLDQVRAVCSALELTALEAPLFFEAQGRPSTTAAHALQTAMRAAQNLETKLANTKSRKNEQDLETKN
ncbi:MAG: hypothetical protein H6510_03055 [Acidobacteria bacterium]|nr:hypothetical protein [Acidobacteriota bacterium]MCB9396775.1 hypothetical protein [Acidobacteriota bacterium]